MKNGKLKRGRPRSNCPLTPAERMRAYRARKRAAGLKSSRRCVPAAPTRNAIFSDHALKDARSLALHCLTARRIAGNPALLRKARANLVRWRKRYSDDAPNYFKEWERKLARPLPEILAFMTEFSEEGVRMRQSSPFAGILSAADRKKIYDAFRP